MATEDANTRRAILDKLAQSREEIRLILDPPPADDSGGTGERARGSDPFPRSRTMRALFSSHGIGAAASLAGGLLIARPRLALQLLRLVPVGTVGKLLLGKVMSGLGAKKGRS